MHLTQALTSPNQPSSLTPKAPPSFKDQDEEADNWDHLDKLPQHHRGRYRYDVGSTEPGAAQKLDELREKDKPKRNIVVRTLKKSLDLLNAALLVSLFGFAAQRLVDSNNPTSATSDWGSNINVMASSSQKHFSTGSLGYTDALLKELSQPSMGSLGQAQDHLELTGYRNSLRQHQYPLSSSQLPQVSTWEHGKGWKIKPNHCLNTWNKDGHPEQKFAILVAGPDPIADISGKKPPPIENCKQMETELQENYLLSSTHIKRIEDATSTAIQESLNQVIRQIQKEKVKNPELMIYLAAHGGNNDSAHQFLFPLLDKRSEGEAIGRILLKDKTYTEPELKNLFKNLPPNIKVTVIMDTCHAGSWIA